MSRELRYPPNSRSGGTVRISLGFYLGVAVVLVVVAGVTLLGPPTKPMINQHADPMPAEQVDSHVLVSPASNLYHSGPGCPYAHNNATPMPKLQAMQRGLVPCPYCIGNSAARLTPTVLPRKTPTKK